jgi:hypothetical protein
MKCYVKVVNITAWNKICLCNSIIFFAIYNCFQRKNSQLLRIKIIGEDPSLSNEVCLLHQNHW